MILLPLAKFDLTKTTQCCSNYYRKNSERKKENSYENYSVYYQDYPELNTLNEHY